MRAYRFLYGSLLCLLLFLAALPRARAAGAEGMTLLLDGARAEFSSPCFIEDGVSYAPLGDFARAMGGCEVVWTGRDALVTADGLTLRAAPDTPWIEANGRFFYVPGGVRLTGGRIFLPLSVLARVWPMELRWDGGTRTVSAARVSGGFPESGETFYPAEKLDLLARIISAESQGEPLAGQIAVGTVVLNRVASPDFPDTMEGVVFQSGQFEPVDNGTVYLPPYSLSVVAAKLCLDGARAAGESLFFFAPALSPGTWIVNNRTFCTAIGCHRFYL